MKLPYPFSNTFPILKILVIAGAYLLIPPISSYVHATDVENEQQAMQIARNSINYAFSDKDLSNLTILDIGSGEGFNAAVMKERGATVHAIDPDKESLENAVQKGRIAKELAYHAKIEDVSEEKKRQGLIEQGVDLNASGWEERFKNFHQIPELSQEFDEKFDIVTIFRIAFDEEGAAKKLSDLLKPKGTLVIGYATSHEYTLQHAEARKALERYFTITSTFELYRETLRDDKQGFDYHQLHEGPESSNAVYVTFKKL